MEEASFCLPRAHNPKLSVPPQPSDDTVFTKRPWFPTLHTPSSSLVDLERYPLTDAALIAKSHAEYLAGGAVVFPNFLTPTALRDMIDEVQSCAHVAFVSRNGHNVYFDAGDPTLPPSHPRNRQVRTVGGSVAYDLLPEGSRLRALYQWEPLLRFVRSVLGLPALHRLDDGIGACTVNVFREGDEQGWHFDETEFSTTLMLTAADDGGDFEYVPAMRKNMKDGSEHSAVSAALDGSREGIRRLPLTPGALAIFRGHCSLHRVTQNRGETTRLVAVLAFNASPGVSNSEYVRELFWGRRHPIKNKL